MDAGTIDAKLIRAETNELQEIMEYHSKRKKELILSAAEKLAEKYDDTSVIGNKLVKAWEDLDISKRYILLNLPPEYKREYTKEKVTPNQVSNLFAELRKLCLDMANMYGTWSKKTLEKPLAETVEKIIIDFHQIHEHAEIALKELINDLCKITQFNQLQEFVKIHREEVVAMRELLDDRVKFTQSWLLTLKMILLYKSYDHVASMLVYKKKYGAKFQSQKDKDKTLEKILTSAGHCPKCDWDWQNWMQRATKRLEKGIETAPKL